MSLELRAWLLAYLKLADERALKLGYLGYTGHFDVQPRSSSVRAYRLHAAKHKTRPALPALGLHIHLAVYSLPPPLRNLHIKKLRQAKVPRCLKKPHGLHLITLDYTVSLIEEAAFRLRNYGKLWESWFLNGGGRLYPSQSDTVR